MPKFKVNCLRIGIRKAKNKKYGEYYFFWLHIFAIFIVRGCRFYFIKYQSVFNWIFGVFHECQVQGFFVILELKFVFVNEHFKITKVT